MIRVLVVEDSLTSQALLKSLLESDPEIQVIDTASNGEEGVRKAAALLPDLITMDIRMPVMDGFEATRRIMAECPTPIVVVSASVGAPDLKITFNALNAGALDVVEKPSGFENANAETMREKLVTTVKLMAEIKVIRRRALLPLAQPAALVRRPLHRERPTAVIAMGASTGGPAALNTIFKSLPRGFAIPIIVVQHISSGFTKGLVEWLHAESLLPMTVVSGERRIESGNIYFAPDDQHLVFTSRGVLNVHLDPSVSHVRPSATVLFNSVARNYGAEAAGVLLTGMGDDGAVGLEAMHRRGAVTFAQDEATSIVYGMPGVAARLGAVDQILPLESIASALVVLTQ